MKKIFLFIISITFIFLILFPLIKVEAAEEYSRNLSNGRVSTCTLLDDSSEGYQSYECICQGVNQVDDCRVGNIISDPICACCGDCTLENFLGIAINLANLIFKYLGVVALVFFVVGGVIWITSGGSQQRIDTGKNILKNALIGIVVIVAATLIIRLLTDVLGVEEGYLDRLPDQEESQNE